ncbi:hypothetical protein EOS_40575 [Caballeronia mineralivorans PML1(12)]|uniref:Uncharacterized protein n=1 Tax=Caballeronia mineralivorans PML1(12) TaxID=908627 RepID=A0A0J1CIX9_9BURK|nr:hypothetical protein EOS_40575 [Caballeronia mineralivorans PML1(12)]
MVARACGTQSTPQSTQTSAPAIRQLNWLTAQIKFPANEAQFDRSPIDTVLKARSDFRNRKESSVTDSWTGIIVGSFGLVVAAVLVAGHYRREWARQRQLRRMDHRHCWDVMRNRH